MKYIIAILLLAVVSAFGQYAPQVNTQGLLIKPPTQATDGYDTGLIVSRDCTDCTGGVAGNVSPGMLTVCTTSASQIDYEWCALSVMNNFSVEGNNLAGYWQSNKYGIGETWAGVLQAIDYAGVGAVVGQELDLNVFGPDNGSRIGLDVVLMETPGETTSVVEGSVGIRIGAFNGGDGPVWTRGIQLTGTQVVGIDTSTATNQTALRLGANQQITFEGTDQIRVRYNPDNFHLEFLNGDKVLGYLDTTAAGGKLN